MKRRRFLKLSSGLFVPVICHGQAFSLRDLAFLAPRGIIGPDGLSYGTVVALDGKTWLDRNLGAARVATSKTDTLGYGALYQWGRLVDGHQITTSGYTATLSPTDVPGNDLFIVGSGLPYDWRLTGNDNLWQGVGGTNNPCPVGFRLPTSAELDALCIAEGITTGGTADKAYNSTLKLPLAGARAAYGTADLFDQGVSGYLWTSTPNSPDSKAFQFTATSLFDNADQHRAYGMSVRAIKN